MQIVFLMVFDASQTALIEASSSTYLCEFKTIDNQREYILSNLAESPYTSKHFQICLVIGVSSIRTYYLE